MPFQEPLDVSNPAYPNTGQPTIHIGHVAGAINVQGGGVILYSEEVTVPANSSTEILIPGPLDGSTKYGVDITWEILTSGAGLTVSNCQVVNAGTGVGVQCAAIRDLNAVEIGEIGAPEIVAFTVPMKSAYPLKIRVYNTHATDSLDGFLHVIATSYALPYPVDTGAYFGVGPLTENLVNPAVGDYVTLPASTSTMHYRMQANVAGLDNVALEQWSSGSSFTGVNFRTSRSPNYQQVGAGAIWDIQEFSTGPFGRPHRLRFFGALAGTIRIQLYDIGR